jgi:multisubunit Na+/H+ antiporter MnhC subunit
MLLWLTPGLLAFQLVDPLMQVLLLTAVID